jgi:hypothetical protein
MFMGKPRSKRLKLLLNCGQQDIDTLPNSSVGWQLGKGLSIPLTVSLLRLARLKRS